MLKTILFTILVMLMKPVLAASLMSHEKFVHLSYEDQKKIVIATMELVVEMESKYKHQVKTSGFDAERFRKYTEFMKAVSNLFFPEAHAATRNTSYGQYLQELDLITRENGRCIYGGWISSMVGDFCTHPTESPFKNQYQAERGCEDGRRKITCNPAIFGFKDVTATPKTLFCVPAGVGQSDNSSRDCMQKALGLIPEDGASPPRDRMRDMISGIVGNPNAANRVFNFLIKACACDANQSRQISDHYANYMRPHQTCYSLLRMMSETILNDECTIKNQILDSDHQSFLRYINTTLSTEQIRSSNVTNLYKEKVDQFVSRSDFRAICNVPPPGDNTLTVDETPNTETGTPGTGPETPPGPQTNPDTPSDTNTCEPPKERVGPDRCEDPCDPATQVRNMETFACDPKPEPDGETDEEEAPSVSITATGKDKDADTTTVTVTINPAETDWSLYTLIWFSRGETRATDANVGGSRTTPPTEDISSPDEGTETTEDHSRDLGDKESLINRDDQKSVDAPRLSNDYEMCARLVLKVGFVKKDEKCVKIPKKPVQAPRNNGMNPFGPQQMGPTRGGPSDAIFRGVR